MKLYLKARNKFVGISIFVLILALVTIFVFKTETLGNFFLGLFASTVIIVIQYNMQIEVEESKLLVEKLKDIYDLSFKFHYFATSSVDHFAYCFKKEFDECKKNLEKLFLLNDELANITDLNEKTKKKLRQINEKISELELDLHFILEVFYDQTDKMKIIYFVELHKQLKNFNFDELQKMISQFGTEIDFNEFYKQDYKQSKKNKFEDLERGTSIQIYNKKIEESNITEYKAVKKEFEKYNN